MSASCAHDPKMVPMSKLAPKRTGQTRRGGPGDSGEGSRGRGWFPRELGSPFPAEDKRGRLSLNLCYSKSSKAVLTLVLQTCKLAVV